MCDGCVAEGRRCSGRTEGRNPPRFNATLNSFSRLLKTNNACNKTAVFHSVISLRSKKETKPYQMHIFANQIFQFRSKVEKFLLEGAQLFLRQSFPSEENFRFKLL